MYHQDLLNMRLQIITNWNNGKVKPIIFVICNLLRINGSFLIATHESIDEPIKANNGFSKWLKHELPRKSKWLVNGMLVVWIYGVNRIEISGFLVLH